RRPGQGGRRVGRPEGERPAGDPQLRAHARARHREGRGLPVPARPRRRYRHGVRRRAGPARGQAARRRRPAAPRRDRLRGAADLLRRRLARSARRHDHRQEGAGRHAALRRPRRRRRARPPRGPGRGAARRRLQGDRPMTRVLVLNGPNLRRLGVREPEKYGSTSFDELAALCRDAGRSLGLDVEVRQTDDEAEMIRWVHEAADERLPIVLNPAAFTHYSYALRDALAQRTAPPLQGHSPNQAARVEVHITNPAAREEFRHTSVVAGVATGTIAGFGTSSYVLALRAVAELTAGDS